jgi:hypothetical protein
MELLHLARLSTDMIKSLLREITLAIQVRSGVSVAVLAYIAVVVAASLTAFAFLCVAAYDWLTQNLGGIFAGLAMAGIFAAIAAIAAWLDALARRRVRERAILERAARARLPIWWLDPKLLAAAIQVGRSLGWQRIAPIVLLGFIAAHLVRGHRARDAKGADTPLA